MFAHGPVCGRSSPIMYVLGLEVRGSGGNTSCSQLVWRRRGSSGCDVLCSVSDECRSVVLEGEGVLLTDDVEVCAGRYLGICIVWIRPSHTPARPEQRTQPWKLSLPGRNGSGDGPGLDDEARKCEGCGEGSG